MMDTPTATLNYLYGSQSKEPHGHNVNTMLPSIAVITPLSLKTVVALISNNEPAYREEVRLVDLC